MSGEQSIRGARFRSNLFVFIIYRRGHGVLSGPCDAQLAEGEVSSLTWVRHHAKGSSLGIPELLPLVCVCVGKHLWVVPQKCNIVHRCVCVCVCAREERPSYKILFMS